MGYDSIFTNGSPLQPSICTAPSGEAGTADAPLLLWFCLDNSLWISTGQLQTLVVPAGPLGQTETFTTYWQILCQVSDFAATFTDDPLNGNSVYMTLSDDLLALVLAKLALPCSGGGSERKMCTAFATLLNANE
jgi:hypothetical protein